MAVCACRNPPKSRAPCQPPLAATVATPKGASSAVVPFTWLGLGLGFGLGLGLGSGLGLGFGLGFGLGLGLGIGLGC